MSFDKLCLKTKKKKTEEINEYNPVSVSSIITHEERSEKIKNTVILIAQP